MELHKYQKRIANFIATHKRCILSVDMGLGKTAAVLAWMAWKKPASALIVAPKRVAETVWKQEAEKWGLCAVAEKMTIAAGTRAKRIAAISDKGKPYKIISRDNLKDVEGMRFDVLIIDELTSFKNPQAARTKAIQNIVAGVRIGLTGTFLANGAIDIYGQAAACGMAAAWGLPNFYAWRGAYFRDVLAGSGLAFQKWVPTGGLDRVLAPIRKDIFTLSAEDWLTIPDVTETIDSVEIGEETRKMIGELDAFLTFEIAGGLMAFDEKQKFAKLQTLCNGFVYDDNGKPVRGRESKKINAVCDYVERCKEAGENVLLFYAFREEKDWICEELDGRGVKWDTVERRGFVDRWNEGKTECLMAHPASAGHGLNLQAGGRVIVWSTLTYNYEYFAQGNARLARQGQKKNVQIRYFIARGTCEERVLMALQAKAAEQKNFVNLTK